MNPKRGEAVRRDCIQGIVLHREPLNRGLTDTGRGYSSVSRPGLQTSTVSPTKHRGRGGRTLSQLSTPSGNLLHILKRAILSPRNRHRTKNKTKNKPTGSKKSKHTTTRQELSLLHKFSRCSVLPIRSSKPPLLQSSRTFSTTREQETDPRNNLTHSPLNRAEAKGQSVAREVAYRVAGRARVVSSPPPP